MQKSIKPGYKLIQLRLNLLPPKVIVAFNQFTLNPIEVFQVFVQNGKRDFPFTEDHKNLYWPDRVYKQFILKVFLV
jgi:hypothetical protein